MIKKIVAAFVVLVIFLAGLIFKTYYDAGELKNITRRFSGTHTIITGVLSSEDISIDQQTGLAIISSADRRARLAKQRPRQGALWGWSLRAEKPKLFNLTRTFREEFNPHGISLFREDAGHLYVFAVNHNAKGHFIEKFVLQDSVLLHLQSIQSPLMHSPNDLVAVSADQFYVTNDHGNRSGLGRILEEYLQLSRSYVLFYNGRDSRVVAEGLAYANGINISPDGRQLFVAATVDGAIHIYNRNAETGDLTLAQTVPLGTGVDNIEVDAAGRLWIGAHPKLLTFVAYSRHAGRLSPSQVLRLTPKPDGAYEIETVFLDSGQLLSGSSVAAWEQGRLLVGSVFDPKFLIMPMD